MVSANPRAESTGGKTMNKEQRKELKRAQELIDKASSILFDALDIIETVRDEEQEKLDNANEGQLATERFQTIEENADLLSELFDELEELKDNCDDIYNNDAFDI